MPGSRRSLPPGSERLLETDHPLMLLFMASALLAPELADPSPVAPDGEPPSGPDAEPDAEPESEPEAREPVDPDAQTFSLFDCDDLVATAVLTAMAPMITDELAQARIRREVAGRRQALPQWLRGLDTVDVVGAGVVTGLPTDGGSETEDLALDVRFGPGTPLAVVVRVDHAAGTVVAETILAPEPLADYLERVGAERPEHPPRFEPLDAAEVGVRILQAIALEARIWTRPPTGSWPATRALVVWLARSLPTGGTGYPIPPWSGDEPVPSFREVLIGSIEEDEQEFSTTVDDPESFLSEPPPPPVELVVVPPGRTRGAERARAELARLDAVYGVSAWGDLGREPLPSEPFGWNGIPESIRPDVEAVVALVDAHLPRRWNTEVQVAVYRLLAAAARRDPRVFHPRADPRRTAAAAVWVVGSANELFGRDGRMLVTDMVAGFGIRGNVSARGRAMLAASGLRTSDADGPMRLTDPRCLIRSHRALVLALWEISERFAEIGR